MGAVPGFCGENLHSSMARNLLGQPPMELGTVPSLLQYMAKLAPFGAVQRLLQNCLNEYHL